MNKKKTFLIRILAVVLLIAIAGVMMIIGRGHAIYLDNKDVEYDGTTYEAPYKVEVFVKGESKAKLHANERGAADWMGQNFKMTVEITEKKNGESVTRDLNVKLPYDMDGIILNIPALLEGLPEEAYLDEFIPTPTEEEMGDEEINTDEFGDMGDM